MHLYKKIAKHKNITYYLCQNKATSKGHFILADLSKIGKGYEEVVAWIDKSKNIEWNEEYEHLIDKQLIKNTVVISL